MAWRPPGNWQLPLLVTGAAVAAYSLSRVFLDKPGPLDTEEGRRKARQKFKRDRAFYDSYAVQSAEEFFTNSRGVQLFGKQWLPQDGLVRGVIFYCHGYADTCTYMWEEVAVKLAKAQYLVVSFDYEGFGLSSGLHAYIPRFDTIVDDVVEFTDKLMGQTELKGLPFFLYGESMGGAVAIKVHWKRPRAWTGAVFLAPMCKMSEEMVPPPLVVAVLTNLAKLFPRLKLVPTKDIVEIGFRDPIRREKVRANPVSYSDKPRLRTAVELLETTQEIQRNLDKVSLPMLVLHGAEDLVTSPEISRDLYESASSSDKTFHLYPGAWHGLLSGEPEEMSSRVFQDVVSWLEARSDTAVRQLAGPLELPDAVALEGTGFSDTQGESLNTAMTTPAAINGLKEKDAFSTVTSR